MHFRFLSSLTGATLCSLALLGLAYGMLSILSLALVPEVQAQEEDNPDLKEAEAEAEAGDPAAAPAEGGDEPADGQAPAPKKKQTQLEFFFNALGVRYTVAFLAISFSFVALVVMNVLTLRRQSIVPLQLIEAFEAHLNEKRYQEAYDLAKNDESFLGHVLSAGLGKLSAGYPQAIEAMQEVGEEETMKLEHRLSYIALIGTISPMVGLLGTVDGMVSAFRVIAETDTQPKPSALAEGISTALITTLVGLWLAIPAVLLFGFLRNRLGRLTLEVGIISEGLMSRFSTVGAKKA